MNEYLTERDKIWGNRKDCRNGREINDLNIGKLGRGKYDLENVMSRDDSSEKKGRFFCLLVEINYYRICYSWKIC